MKSILIVGAGITGGYTAARLLEGGADVTLLARGAKADRIEADGLRLRDAIVDEEKTVRLPIDRAPGSREYDIVMVCVQAVHRPGVEELLPALPGRPIVWFLGNTVEGYEAIADVLGRDRVLGGFPSVGGTWDGEVLVYADRQTPEDERFNSLIAGPAFHDAATALEIVQETMKAAGQTVTVYDPIMAWHLCHAALILPLAGALYASDGDRDALGSDRHALKRSVRAVVQGLAVVRKSGYPILPSRLKSFRFIPAGIGARKIAALMESKFGRIALAGHANTARGEMHHLAQGLFRLAGDRGGRDFRELLADI